MRMSHPVLLLIPVVLRDAACTAINFLGRTESGVNVQASTRVDQQAPLVSINAGTPWVHPDPLEQVGCPDFNVKLGVLLRIARGGRTCGSELTPGCGMLNATSAN